MNQISCDNEHKFFHPDYRFARIFLDEEIVKYVITADADEGYVIVHSRKNGQLQFDGDDIVTETIRGKVRIEMRYNHGNP